MEEISELMWVFLGLLFVGIYVFIKNFIELVNRIDDLENPKNTKKEEENGRAQE